MAMQNFLLIVHEKGLGTRVKDGIKFLMNFDKLRNKLYKEFKIPLIYFLISGIQLGYLIKKTLERSTLKRLSIKRIRKFT